MSVELFSKAKLALARRVKLELVDLSFGAQLPSDHDCYLLVRAGYKHNQVSICLPDYASHT